jgi:hypothetical protein
MRGTSCHVAHLAPPVPDSQYRTFGTEMASDKGNLLGLQVYIMSHEDTSRGFGFGQVKLMSVVGF